MTDPAKLEQEALKATGFVAAAQNMEQQNSVAQTAKEVPVTQEPNLPQEPEEEQQREPTPEEKMEFVAQQIALRFPGVQNLPDVNRFKTWKQTHGGVFFLDLGGTDMFIYRYLKRVEYMGMTADPGWQKLSKDEREERIVDKCLLWPFISPEQKAIIPAGKIELIAEQISIHSMFIDPAQVAAITIKL
jgi:hypothetical protein